MYYHYILPFLPVLSFLSIFSTYTNAINNSGIDNKVDTDEGWAYFTEFLSIYHKKYETLDELRIRYDIFRTNIFKIITHNINPYRNFTMDINHFADLTEFEFKNRYINGLDMSIYESAFSCKKYISNTSSYNIIPKEYDWTELKVVNTVRDQGSCGSCWAFATIANAESIWAIYSGELLDFSEQYLVDCASGIGYYNRGCNGGQPDSAFKYMISNGICSETEYPYNAETNKCLGCIFEKDYSNVFFKDCYDIEPNNQQDLKAAVFQNPVVVAIEADTRYFQFYSSGILTDSIKCGTNLDHAVEIVGYGIENGIEYWKVRNSWGESWGEEGYVRIQRTDSVNDAGVCGIAMEPSFIHI